MESIGTPENARFDWKFVTVELKCNMEPEKISNIYLHFGSCVQGFELLFHSADFIERERQQELVRGMNFDAPDTW